MQYQLQRFDYMGVRKYFRSVKELTELLQRRTNLLDDMFEKRKLEKYPLEDAIEHFEGDEKKLQELLDYSVLIETENGIEIESVYLNFFEDVLNVNEEISVLSVKEYIGDLSKNIDYFSQETDLSRKVSYQKKVRDLLRKIGDKTWKNVLDLQRNIDNTYKQEPNYAIKKMKLESLDEKRDSISTMIKECEKLIDKKRAFFKGSDPHMAMTCSNVEGKLRDVAHALIAIETQVIQYLNRIELQNKLYEKVRKLKYLQDQLLIKTDTNLVKVLEERNPLWMESRQYNRILLSLETLRGNEDILNRLRRIAERNRIQQRVRMEAKPLSDEDLKEHTLQLEEVDSAEVWKAFLASDYNLFEFILEYDYKVKRTIEEHTTLFCQLAVLYPDECRITDQYAVYQDVEYPIVYAK